MNFVGQRDLNIIYHILLEKRTDLSRMIMSYMMDQKNRKPSSLSYGMLLTELFENVEIDLSNEASRKLNHSNTYNEKSLKRMGFIKVKEIWLHKDKHASTSKPDEESNEECIPSDIPNISKNVSTNNVSFNSMLTKDILTKIIKSIVNIVKEEPLRRIVKSTLTESTQIEILRSTIQSAIPTITSTKSEYFEILKNKEYMQKMIAATIILIQGKPLSKIVSPITVRTMISEYL